MGDTLAGLLLHTSPQVPILLAGAVEHDLERTRDEVAGDEGGRRELPVLGLGPGAGFAELANAASAAVAGDLVLVAPGVQVGPEWLDRLRSAARCDSTVVSATALGDAAGPLSVPGNDVSAHGVEITQPHAALAVIARSQRLYPRITSARHHCVYLRRAILDRLEGFTPGLDPEEALAELSLRAVESGMVHVAADDVYVVCTPSFGRRSGARSEEQPSPLAAGQPVARGHSEGPAEMDGAPAAGTSSVALAVDEQDDRGPLRRAVTCAGVALHGMSVTIDARALGPGVGGTQLYTVQLILALASRPGLRLRVVVPPDLPEDVAKRLSEERALEVITYEEAVGGVAPSHIVHRPQQVFTVDDLNLLFMLGERIVVGQQDLIAYRNPSYHASIDGWLGYRRVTRLALAAADRVVFFSQHSMSDVVAEDLAGPERCDVAGIGADLDGVARPEPVPVPGVPLDRDLLVCIGADYRHKNRPFAIALLEALRARHGWSGCLIFAGGHVPHGSSRDEEQRLLAGHPGLADSVIDVGRVDEPEKAWLYERARAVVYPTLYEGFGLVPFEAARSDTPCLFAPQASLVELAGPDAATLVPWDASLSSDSVVPLLTDTPERERHLRLLRDGMARSRWSGVVERLDASYTRAIETPFRAAVPRAWQELERERFITSLESVAEEYQRAYHDLRASVGAGLPLVAEGGLLSRDEQRGLMRIASRRSLRGVLLSPIGLLGRLGTRTPDDGATDDRVQGEAVKVEGRPDQDTGSRC